MNRPTTKTTSTKRVFGACLLSFMTLIAPIASVSAAHVRIATLNSSVPTSTTRVSQQDTVSGKFSDVVTDDQRGLLRPVHLADPPYPNTTAGDASNIGAYELQVDTVQSGTPSFIVNTPDDHDDGECTDGDCTLREAIIAANSDLDTSTITFDIPGAGPHIIQLATWLSY